jgi:hypothetical protein
MAQMVSEVISPHFSSIGSDAKASPATLMTFGFAMEPAVYKRGLEMEMFSMALIGSSGVSPVDGKEGRLLDTSSP